MFWRICRLLTLNIQLIVVFDGPGVPAKRGRNGGRKIDYEKLKLLKEVLRCFGIPYQEAPGEAEAECARLQILGLVDAVWSQDSDFLMFGCSFWIHDDRLAKQKGITDRGKENTRKSGKTVRVVRAKEMKEKLDLHRESFVLFAMLAGGDYNETGLRGCGAATALSAARDGQLAQSLCLCRNQRDCVEWSFRLAAFLHAKPRTRNLHIPADFPDFKILQKYYRPKVTNNEPLMTMKSLDLTMPRPIDELKLLEVTSSRFNIWGRLYMDWVGPVLLSRALLLRDSSQPEEVLHGIRFTKQRASKSEEVMAMRSLERKITFSPFAVTTLRREDFEGGEREGMWDGRRDIPFDPQYRVECDLFPAFVLRWAIPQDIFDPPPTAPKQKASKRKEGPGVDTVGEPSTSPAKKKQKPRKTEQAETNALPRPGSVLPSGSISTAGDKRMDRTARSRPLLPRTNQQASSTHREVIDLSEIDEELLLRLPPVRTPQHSPLGRESMGGIVDLGPPESSEDEDNDLAGAVYSSMQVADVDCDKQVTTIPSKALSMPRTPTTAGPPRNAAIPAFNTTTIVNIIDNKASSTSKTQDSRLNALDEIRNARIRHFGSSPCIERITPTRTAQRPAAVVAECIDLTGDRSLVSDCEPVLRADSVLSQVGERPLANA
jgi:Holliday junction resolvase YEN1